MSSLTIEHLVSLIDARLTSYESASNPIASTRAYQLRNIRTQLVEHGFPADVDTKCRLSVLPLIFQEANYDDLDWSEKDADLGHLSDMFRIDFALFFEGRSRSDVTEAEYRSYFESGLRCIARWQRRDPTLRIG
ncbi:MAG: hypothetical protein WD971_03100 [Pirellulales bacterium]